MDSAPQSAHAIERIYREEYGRIVASLVRRFGDIDIAEEAAGEALLAAVERWPRDGVPPNPGGWLTTTAASSASPAASSAMSMSPKRRTSEATMRPYSSR